MQQHLYKFLSATNLGLRFLPAALAVSLYFGLITPDFAKSLQEKAKYVQPVTSAIEYCLKKHSKSRK